MTERRQLHLGQVVIINDIDQPCSRMASVIVAIEGDNVRTKYLAKLSEFDYWNTTCAINQYDLVTPIEDFGVRFRVEGDKYWCEPVGESVATYPDGKRRPWQEHSGPLRWKFRPSAMQLVSMTGVERTQAAPVADAQCATDMSLAFANAAWGAYSKNGFDDVPNYLTLKYDRVQREEVVAALMRPEIRSFANSAIEGFARKIAEISTLLQESEKGTT